MDVVLWQIEISHYNEKARWALDYKRIPHERRAPMPGLTGPVSMLLTRGSSRRMPVLQIDGETIHDSSAIIAALDERRPEPQLIPTNAAERTRALRLEEFFDTELAPDVRRFIWQHTFPDDDAVLDSVLPNGGRLQRAILRAAGPVAKLAMRRDYEISEKSAARALEKIRSAMDRLETELDGNDYLVGDSFSVADLTAAALFTPLICPSERQYPPKDVVPRVAEVRAELEARPGGAWVHEIYARHRGNSAEIGAPEAVATG